MSKSSDAGIIIKTIKYSSSYTCNNFALLCTSSDTIGHSRMLETMTHVGSPMQQTSWLLQEMIPVPHNQLYLLSILWTWSLRRCCLLHQQVYTPVTILSRSWSLIMPPPYIEPISYRNTLQPNINTNTKIHLSFLHYFFRHITIKWSVLLLIEKPIVGLHCMGNKKYTRMCSQ